MIKILLILFATFPAVSMTEIPYGHKSAFMGNATSGSGEIGSASDFGSAYVFGSNKTELVSGFMYSFIKINDDQLEGSKTENELIPYYVASGFEFYDSSKLVLYTRSTGNIFAEFDFSDLEEGYQGKGNTSTKDIEFGVSISKKLLDFLSIGVTSSLIIKQSSSFTRIHGSVAGFNFMSTSVDKNKSFSIDIGVSSSVMWDKKLFSFFIKSRPFILKDKSYEENITLIDGQEISRREVNYNPYDEDPWRAGIGIKIPKKIINIFSTLTYMFPRSYSKIIGTDDIDKRDISYKGFFNYSFGVEVPNKYSKLLFGHEHEQKQEDKLGEWSLEEQNVFTLGIELSTIGSRPILGAFYQKGAGSNGVQIIGLMYSSKYSF